MSEVNTNWEMAHFATVEERAMAVSLVLAIAVTERKLGNNGETRGSRLLRVSWPDNTMGDIDRE